VHRVFAARPRALACYPADLVGDNRLSSQYTRFSTHLTDAAKLRSFGFWVRRDLVRGRTLVAAAVFQHVTAPARGCRAAGAAPPSPRPRKIGFGT
jgi:hypothetical protein